MKQVTAKLIIWSLNILIQWDKLFNHWPHADKVYMATEVDLSITFQTICSTWTGFLLQQKSAFQWMWVPYIAQTWAECHLDLNLLFFIAMKSSFTASSCFIR